MPEYCFTKYPVNVSQLAGEIETDIAKKVEKALPTDTLDGHITYSDEAVTDNLCITFDTALTTQEETDLGATVSNHTPV